MTDSLITKVVDDLTGIPRHVPFQLAPYKISDPFLDERIFDICELINEKLPNARLSFITNGSMLTSDKIAKLAELKLVSYLTISLNFHRADDYERVMGIPFERVIHNLDVIHQHVNNRSIKFPIKVTRVAEDEKSDKEFLGWTKDRYPLFHPFLLPRNDWIGQFPDSYTRDLIPDAPCHRWFDFSITATGAVAMCCMDGNAQFPKGNVSEQHVLEIYNQDHLRRLRENIPSRKSVGAPCDRCTYLSN